jgi:hypothetical protein
MLQSGGLDLASDGGKTDGVADDAEVVLAKTDACPAGRCGRLDAVGR